MSIDVRPPYVCTCGEVLEDALVAVNARDEVIATLEEDIANLERDLRSKRAQNRRLKAEQDIMLRQDEHYSDAMDVLHHWKRECSPNARELHGKRLENTIARLRGKYTPDELKRACDGYALKPFVVNGRRTHEGPKDSWQADAELIFRDARHVDAGLRIAERADDLRQVLAAVPDSAPSDPGETVAGSLSPLGEAALRLARYGFMVFPCRPREKTPATPHGLQDAKRDPRAIRACWSQHPHMNIGVRCGKESGIVVLDVDGDEGWESLHRLEDAHGELPTTASVTTPRGGQHFYFRHPGSEIRNTAGYPGEGLDIRGDGGYVLAPPSIGPGGRQYEVDEQASIAAMPEWLLDLLVNRQKNEDKTIGPGRDWGAFISQGSSKGERDNRMTSYVGHLFSHGHDASEVLEAAKVLNTAKVQPPLADKDLHRIVKSIAAAEARRVA